MKISAPFDTAEEVLLLIKAGADELYCGVYSDSWKEIGTYPNARYIPYGNLESFQQLREALMIAKKYNVPVYLCANEFLGQDASEFLLKDISQAIAIGIDGFIVADFNLIPSIKRLKKTSKIILSSLNPCFNSSALRFYKNLGVNRIVLPYNQLTLEELKDILKEAQKISMETEVFSTSGIMCKNVNGFCLYHKIGFKNLYKSKYKYGHSVAKEILRWLLKAFSHSLNKKIRKMIWTSNLYPHTSCREKFDAEVLEKFDGRYIKQNTPKEFLFNMYFQNSYCTVCLKWLLSKVGLTAVKIEGRGRSTEQKIKDIKTARKYTEEMEKGYINDDNFEQRGKHIIRIIHGFNCLDENCYHIVLSQNRLALKKLNEI